MFHSFTPLGIPVDEYCLGRGSTTVCAAGDAGGPNYKGSAQRPPPPPPHPTPPNPTHAAVHHRFVEFIAKPATTRVVGLANISADGLAAGGRGSWYNGVGGELDHVSSATVGFLECCL